MALHQLIVKVSADPPIFSRHPAAVNPAAWSASPIPIPATPKATPQFPWSNHVHFTATHPSLEPATWSASPNPIPSTAKPAPAYSWQNHAHQPPAATPPPFSFSEESLRGQPTRRLQPEYSWSHDSFFSLEPHPLLNAATWDRTGALRNPAVPLAKPEYSWIHHAFYATTLHPALNVASWERDRFGLRNPFVAAAKPEYSWIHDTFFSTEPHPMLDAAVWDRTGAVKNPPTAPARPEFPWTHDTFFTLEPHPSLNIAAWEMLGTRPRKGPFINSYVPEIQVIPAPLVTAAANLAQLPELHLPIAARILRTLPDEPMTYAALNPILTWARWSSDSPQRPAFVRRDRIVTNNDLPFVSSALAVEKWLQEGLDRGWSKRFVAAPAAAEFPFTLEPHPSLNVASWSPLVNVSRRSPFVRVEIAQETFVRLPLPVQQWLEGMARPAAIATAKNRTITEHETPFLIPPVESPWSMLLPRIVIPPPRPKPVHDPDAMYRVFILIPTSLRLLLETTTRIDDLPRTTSTGDLPRTTGRGNLPNTTRNL